MIRTILLLVAAAACTCTLQAQQWSPDHVHYGLGGGLTYTPDSSGNIIPDFSHVGYRYGDQPIPDVEVKITLEPVEGDDGAAIQGAIDSLSAMEPDAHGFRGAVLLKAGTYQVGGQIRIRNSGIVLRGEGDSVQGTVIVATGTGQRDLITADNGASRSVDESTGVSIAEDYVPVGRKYVVVSDASGFSEGDQIVLFRPGTARWISDIKMDQITPSEGTYQWDPSGYSFYFERLVTGVNGDTLFFRNPVVMAMESVYGGGKVFKFSFNRLEKIGIEHLRLESVYASETDEEHSWKAIAYYSVEHSWVRNVTSWYFAYSCVSLERGARLITVADCHCREPKSLITGSRRYSFNLVGSLCLFTGCTATEGRHDFVTGSRVTGPNVFTRCSASRAHADSGPHHRWAMGTLFDVIRTDGELNVQDRDDMGSGHGWAGANQVFWNCSGRSSICESPWASARNYNFGFMGAREEGFRPGRPPGEWVGHNLPGIFPASLYEAQLDERLNGTRVFSAFSQLQQVTDSTFRMSFNMPLDPEQITSGGFAISGTAGEGLTLRDVVMEDDYSVLVTFGEPGILPPFSTIVVTSGPLTSRDGLPLEGLFSAVYMEPDRRPVVTGEELTIDNEGGVALASSTKPGRIYLILFGTYPKTLSELDSLLQINQGKAVDAPVADLAVQIPSKGLPGGYYNYYATDMDGRVSKAAPQWVKVEATGPVGTEERNGSAQRIRVWQVYGNLMVDPGTPDMYAIDIFTVTGNRIFTGTGLRGRHSCGLNGYRGILLVRCRTSGGSAVSKVMVH